MESDQAVDSNQDEEENVTLTSMDMDLLATQPKPTEPPSHSWTEYEGYWFWRNLPSNIDSPGLQQQNTTGPKEKLAKLVKTGPARKKAVLGRRGWQAQTAAKKLQRLGAELTMARAETEI